MSAVSLTINRIECLKKSENGHDEVYIEYYPEAEGGAKYPVEGNHPMDPEEDKWWDPNLTVPYNDYILVELRDNDTAGSDLLGAATFSREEASEKMTRLVSNTNGALYKLYINQ